jgi:hypothetical protein
VLLQLVLYEAETPHSAQMVGVAGIAYHPRCAGNEHFDVRSISSPV